MANHHSIFTPHQLTKDVKLLHKVAIIQSDKVFILKRSEDSVNRPGKWDLPGGNSEWPVDLRHSAQDLYKLDIAREVFEESGVRVKPTKFDLHSLVYFSTYFDIEKQVYTVICGWKIRNIGKKKMDIASISEEHTAMAWASLEELDNFDFGGKTGEFVKEIIRNGFKG
jgi:8-oxo-dGTP pyrophosphatase MutT (NUDIX family)